MKTKLDRLLLPLFLVFSVISILAVLVWLELLPDFGVPIGVRSEIALILSVFPAFFLQMLLCRNAKRGWVKALPFLVLWAIVMACFISFLAASGWDSLGWVILLILCIPPAIGILLGWIAYAVIAKSRRARHS